MENFLAVVFYKSSSLENQQQVFGKNTFLHESIAPIFLFRMAQTVALYHNRLKSYSKKY